MGSGNISKLCGPDIHKDSTLCEDQKTMNYGLHNHWKPFINQPHQSVVRALG